MKQKLDKASWVCTTADSWTSRRKSFLGVTVHWLTPELKRVSGCLAIRRVIGKCDYEVLAKLLESIHEEFEVTKKVTATITDNGSNFVKAFRIYGASPDTQQTNNAVRNVQTTTETIVNVRQNLQTPVAPAPPLIPNRHLNQQDNNDILDILDEAPSDYEESEEEADDDEDGQSGQEQEDTEESESDQHPDQEDDEPDGFIELTEIFDQRHSSLIYSLPPHRRCAAHTLNLIATNDVYKNLSTGLDNLKASTERVLRKLWSNQNRSAKAADAIREHVKKLFVVHNATRWNSFFNAVDRVKYFINKHKSGLKAVFSHFGIPYFRPAEEDYIREYVKVMRPLAEALDILQADVNVTIGYLLPTLSVLMSKMNVFRDKRGIVHCKPLVSNIIEGLNTRFSECFRDEDLRFAAMVHPKFKISWIKEADRQNYIEKLLDFYDNFSYSDDNAETDGTK